MRDRNSRHSAAAGLLPQHGPADAPRRLIRGALLAALALAALYFASGSQPAQAQSGSVDYDVDNDRLIEVGNLAQLNAIRWDLDGDGTPAAANAADYEAAFPNGLSGMGCPTGCQGYEFIAKLDFDTNGNGVADADDAYWNDGAGWEPIGSNASPAALKIDGNLMPISNLYINRPTESQIGLFGRMDGPADFAEREAKIKRIERVSLVDVNITGNGDVGALLGYFETPFTGIEPVVRESSATGQVIGNAAQVGGLVGSTARGMVTHSWANVTVSGQGANVGGLVGIVEFVSFSYSSGAVTGQTAHAASTGGVYGHVTDTATSVYYDSATSTQTRGGTGYTTAQLQAPTGYTGIYSGWNVGDTGAGTSNYWDFGTSSEYPRHRLGAFGFALDSSDVCELSVFQRRQTAPAGRTCWQLTSGGAGHYAVSGAPAWLEAAPGSDGALGAMTAIGSNTTHALTLRPSAAAAQMEPGTYQATLTILNTGSRGREERTVRLTVKPAAITVVEEDTPDTTPPEPGDEPDPAPEEEPDSGTGSDPDSGAGTDPDSSTGSDPDHWMCRGGPFPDDDPLQVTYVELCGGETPDPTPPEPEVKPEPKTRDGGCRPGPYDLCDDDEPRDTSGCRPYDCGGEEAKDTSGCRPYDCSGDDETKDTTPPEPEVEPEPSAGSDPDNWLCRGGPFPDDDPLQDTYVELCGG